MSIGWCLLHRIKKSLVPPFYLWGLCYSKAETAVWAGIVLVMCSPFCPPHSRGLIYVYWVSENIDIFVLSPKLQITWKIGAVSHFIFLCPVTAHRQQISLPTKLIHKRMDEQVYTYAPKQINISTFPSV